MVDSNTMTLLEALKDRFLKANLLRFGNELIDLASALESTDSNILRAAQNEIIELGKGLPELVVADERFPGMKAQMVRGVGGMATGFYPNFVGAPLVRYAVQMGSPEAAIEWLLEVMSTSSATGKFIHTLWGVRVAQEFSLTDDVRLVPIEALPVSVQKNRLLNDHSRMRSQLSTTLDWVTPQSALVTEIRIEPFLGDEGHSLNSDVNAFMEKKELLEDIMLALSVVGPCTPMLATQWTTLDDPRLEQAGFLSGATMRMGKNLEILPCKPIDAPALNPDEAAKLVQAFLNLHPKTKQKFRVALNRLIQAQLRHNIGDQAVELSTAFETLLGDGHNNEMIHKVTVRLVKMIGGDYELRRKNYVVMKTTYEYRSALLHTGFIDPVKTKMINGVKMSALDIVSSAITLCVDLIKTLLLQGAIPEWTDFDIT